MKRNIIIENNVVNDYLLGINNKELCEKYNKSRSYIQKVLLKNNIKLRSGAEISKKYNIKENFFEIIDDEDKAYILGLLFSDGTISDTVVKINLIESDSQIIYDIAKKMYYDDKYQISFLKGVNKKWNNGVIYKTKPQILLTFTRKKIVDDLKKLGLSERKSFKIRFPKICRKYYKDFVRGYFDGDGCFYTSKKYKKNNRVGIVSNILFINDLKNIIENKLSIKCITTNSKYVNNISTLWIYGNIKTKNFLDWIYDKANLKLNRKYLHYINEY